MTESLRILILEDNPSDAELVQFELEEAGFVFTSKVVMAEEDFVRELQEYAPDIILSDYDLPRYNGVLALAEARRRRPDTPFILVTGAVTEDRAIDILTQGAKDYVLKTRLQQRLVPAVRRALAEAEEHRARKQVEEMLRESEALLREIAANIPGAIYKFRINPDGSYTMPYISAGAENLLELPVSSLTNSSMFFENVHPADVCSFRQSIVEATQRMERWTQEFRIVNSDGRVKWLHGSSNPAGLPDGSIIWNGVLLDITKQKQAEEELSRSQEELKTIYDHAPVMMCIVDTERRILNANVAFKAFIAIPENDLKEGHACGVFGCINALDDPRGCGFGKNCKNCALRLAMDDTFKTGMEHHHVEHHTILLREGVKREVTLLGSTTLIYGTEQKRLLLCLNDITEHKQTGENLQTSEE
jgi:PAS domain S-box-containing protein